MIHAGETKTAIGAAMMRAAHRVLDPEPRWIDDPLAVGFVPGSSAEEIRGRRLELDAQVWRHMRADIVKRDRAAECGLEAAVAEGVSQYLLLGAGFDTFAYRQPQWAHGLSIIEIDHPATQTFKRECLAAHGLVIPGNVELYPLDFERQSLERDLKTSRFDSARATLLSWLGVTPYLSRPAIEGVLRFVLSLQPPSRIVFSFYRPTAALSGPERAAVEQVEEFTAARGQPSISRFEIDEMMTWLAELGFARSSIIDVATIPTATAASGRRLPGTTFGQIVCAEV